MTQFGDGLPDSVIMMLAGQILKRARVTLPNTTRAQALAIIKGVRIAPSKSTPTRKTFRRLSDPCIKCGGPVYFGEPCRVCFDGTINQHIECEAKQDALYATCVSYVEKLGICPKENS